MTRQQIDAYAAELLAELRTCDPWGYDADTIRAELEELDSMDADDEVTA